MKLRHFGLFLGILLQGASIRAQVTADFTADVTSGCVPLVVNLTDLSSGGATNWQWSTSNGTQSSLQNPTVTFIAPGTYTITLIAFNGTGSDTLQRTSYIQVFDNPIAGFALVDSPAGCAPFRVDLLDQSMPVNGAISSWLWDFGDGSISNLPNPGHSYAFGGTFSISLEVSDINGCSDVVLVQNMIRVVDPPIVDFTGSQTFSCTPPLNVTFTPTISGTPPFQYDWDFGDGTQSAQPAPSHQYLTAGSFTVGLNLVDSVGCADTTLKTHYVVIAEYIGDLFVDQDTGCLYPVQDTFRFMDLSGPFRTFSMWDFGDGNGSLIRNPTHRYSTPGQYVVTLISGNSSCIDTVRDTIVYQELQAGYTSDTQFSCKTPTTINFSDQSFNASSWQWNFEDGNSSVLPNPTHVYLGSGNFTVQLVVTNDYGCTDTINNLVIDISPVIASIDVDTPSGCIPHTISFFDSSWAPGNIVLQAWNLGNGATATGPSASTTYNTPGIFNVQLVVTDDLGCQGQASAHVQAGFKPTVTASLGADTACANQDVLGMASSPFATNYQWIFDDVSTNTPDTVVSLDISDTGTFYMQVVAYHFGCPSDTYDVFPGVYVHGAVASMAALVDCSDHYTVNFENKSINGLSWKWEFGDGDSSIVENPTHTYAARGFYSGQLTVVDTSVLCIDTISFGVRITEPIARFTLSDSIGCGSLDNVSFDASASQDADWKKLTWFFGNGQLLNDTMPDNLSDLIQPTGIDYDTAGIYTVSLWIPDSKGCFDIATATIEVRGHSTDFTGLDGAVCANELFTLTDTTIADTTLTAWSWSFGDGDTASGPVVTHRYTQPGSYTIQLSTTDASGCTGTKQRTIDVPEPHSEFFTSVQDACTGDGVFFTNTSMGNNLTYLWNFGDGSTSTQLFPFKTYTQTGIFYVELIVTDSAGCTDTFTQNFPIEIGGPIAGFSLSDSVSPWPSLSRCTISRWVTSWVGFGT